MAHYHMGGVQAEARMQTGVPGLLAAGEAVGGANGANRLSGNAISEALVFGRRAGRSAAEIVRAAPRPDVPASAAQESIDLICVDGGAREVNTAGLIEALQATMGADVGPFRDEARLNRALASIAELSEAMGTRPPAAGGAFDMRRLDWFDLRNMLLVARVVTEAALTRRESRGAHQRDDAATTLAEWELNQAVTWRDGSLAWSRLPSAKAQAA